MKCAGSKTFPSQVLKKAEIRTFPSGRNRKVTGRGTCGVCGGCYAVILQKNGVSGLFPHKDLRTCTDTTKKAHRRMYLYWTRVNQVGSLPLMANHMLDPLISTGQTVDQRVNIIESAGQTQTVYTGQGITSYGYATGGTATNPFQFFRMELSSQTYNAQFHAYLYSFNGETFWYPSPVVTVATDYATWNTWNNTMTLGTNSRVESGLVWNSWTTPTYQAQLAINNENYYSEPRLAPAEVQERLVREREALFTREEAKRIAKAEAQQKAENTLLSLLSSQQRREYQERKQFHIRGSKGTLFRILHGSSGNVRVVTSEADEDRGLHAFCAHPQMAVRDDDGVHLGFLPHEDAMITQMLHLMEDEDAFLAVANRHW